MITYCSDSSYFIVTSNIRTYFIGNNVIILMDVIVSKVLFGTYLVLKIDI